MESKSTRKFLPYLYTAPATVFIYVLVAFPILYSVFLSLTNLNMYHWAQFDVIGLDNYGRILSGIDSEFFNVLLRTIIWTAANLILIVAISIGLALLLNMKELKLKGLMRTVLILPWAVPSYITSLIWKGMFNYDFGAVNAVFEKIGIGRIEWLTNPVNGMIASIIVNVWLSTPFMMLVCLGALQSIDRTYYEAADMDGAGALRKFFKITLPLIKPALLPALVLTGFVTFKQFDIIYLMTGGLAGKLDVVMTYGYNLAYNAKNYSLSAAFSVIVFILLLAMTLLNLRLSRINKEV